MKPKYLIIPENRWKDIRTLLALSASQMQTIAKILRSKETLKAKEPSYQRIAKDVTISQADALAILSAVTNLITQRQRYSLSNEQLLDDLEAGANTEVKNLTTEAKTALFDLLSESEEGYFVEKAESLKLGFSPHLVSVRSICDVRPIFDKTREKIEGALFVTFLGLTMHDEDHENHTVVLQLGQAELKQLRECIEEAEKKAKRHGKRIRDKVRAISLREGGGMPEVFLLREGNREPKQLINKYDEYARRSYAHRSYKWKIPLGCESKWEDLSERALEVDPSLAEPAPSDDLNVAIDKIYDELQELVARRSEQTNLELERTISLQFQRLHELQEQEGDRIMALAQSQRSKSIAAGLDILEHLDEIQARYEGVTATNKPSQGSDTPET